MHNLIQDIRYAARMLRRHPGFTAVAILTLALGIGANTAVFTVVNSVLLRPLPFPQSERLFLISNVPKQIPFAPPDGLTERHYLEFRRYDRLFENIATFNSSSAIMTGNGDPARVPTASVTTDFFSVLHVRPAMGRTMLVEEEQPGRDQVVLLSDKLWRNRFGSDPQVLGSTTTLDGVPHTVIGVMPAGFSFPSDAELWMPLGIHVDPHNSMLRTVIGRLKPSASPAQAQSEMESFDAASPSSAAGYFQGDVTPQILPLKELLVGDIRKSLLIFLGAVAFVLLIACANVANLLLMRAASRQHEIAVRAALGAGRWPLMRHLLAESTLVALAGGAAGLVLALWGVPLLLELAPTGKIPRLTEIHIDGGVLAFTFGVSLLAGIAFGMAPAVQAARRGLRAFLTPGSRSVTGRHERLRSALVVAEIALALVLVTGAGLMVKSFLRLRAVNPGFHPQNVLTMTVDLPPAVYRNAKQMQSFHERILAKVSGIPGVVAAGAVNWRPLGRALIRGDFQVEGGRKGYWADKMTVSPHYFRAMEIGLLSGRDFTERDNATAPGAVIISQSVALQLWPGEDAVGKRISTEDHPKPNDWLTIVGVVGDIRQEDLTKKPDAAVYQPYLQVTFPFFLNHMTFAVRTDANPQGVASAMRGVLQEVDKDQPVPPIASMNDLIATVTAEPQFQTRLLGGFSFLALLLAAVGVYGVLAYSVTERTQEIGIRIALGAATSDVLGMVLRRTLLLAAAGVALGTVGALITTRVLAKFLFEVTPTDPATFASVAALLAVVALVAGWLPARRATKVDPLVSLRYE